MCEVARNLKVRYWVTKQYGIKPVLSTYIQVSFRPPKTSRRQLSDYEKGMIIAFFYCFGYITAVAKLVGRPWTTVKFFLARATEHCSIDDPPGQATLPFWIGRRIAGLLRQKKPIKLWPETPSEIDLLIPMEFFEKLWRSMPNRVAAVIEAKG